MDQIGSAKAAYAALLDSSLKLDAYYIPIRYPNSIPDSIPARIFTRGGAGEAVRLADEMVTHVTDRLGRMEGGGGGG